MNISIHVVKIHWEGRAQYMLSVEQKVRISVLKFAENGVCKGKFRMSPILEKKGYV